MNRLLLLMGLAFVLAAASPAAKKAVPPLRPVPAHLMAPSWDGVQFLGATKKGQVHLLDGEHLALYSQDSEEAAPSTLEPLPKVGAPGWVRHAAMNRDGDRWALLDGSSVRLFVRGKEVEMEAVPWNPQGVGFQGDDLVAVVLPEAIQPGVKERTSAPLAVHWDGRRWGVLVEEEPLDEAESKNPMLLQQRRTASLYGDVDRRLWLASTHRYRLRQYTPAGRLLTEITVGGGDVEEVSAEQAAARLKEMQDEVLAQGVPPAEVAKGKFVVNKAKVVVVALADGPDGRLYVLAHAKNSEDAGSDLVLDRYDPGANTLERVRLSLELRGWLSMVAGKDGLAIASHHAGEGGRWELSWERLEAAPWEPVEGAEIGSGS